MWFEPGHIVRANIAVLVSTVVLIVGILIVGRDASDTEMQIVGAMAFVVGMATLTILLDRLDRQQGRRR